MKAANEKLIARHRAGRGRGGLDRSGPCAVAIRCDIVGHARKPVSRSAASGPPSRLVTLDERQHLQTRYHHGPRLDEAHRHRRDAELRCSTPHAKNCRPNSEEVHNPPSADFPCGKSIIFKQDRSITVIRLPARVCALLPRPRFGNRRSLPIFNASRAGWRNNAAIQATLGHFRFLKRCRGRQGEWR